MEKLIKKLAGRKTYIVGATIVIFNGLLMANILTLEPNHIEAINYILVASGITTLRLGIAKAK